MAGRIPGSATVSPTWTTLQYLPTICECIFGSEEGAGRLQRGVATRPVAPPSTQEYQRPPKRSYLVQPTTNIKFQHPIPTAIRCLSLSRQMTCILSQTSQSHFHVKACRRCFISSLLRRYQIHLHSADISLNSLLPSCPSPADYHILRLCMCRIYLTSDTPL